MVASIEDVLDFIDGIEDILDFIDGIEDILDFIDGIEDVLDFIDGIEDADSPTSIPTNTPSAMTTSWGYNSTTKALFIQFGKGSARGMAQKKVKKGSNVLARVFATQNATPDDIRTALRESSKTTRDLLDVQLRIAEP
ncbi:hypothetical protein CONLIGDRAFT_678002 [Coniochaeta ligniaria NRRL 30616]|uniref:Uncharacterized protein n=1 Tax=Coniochaeta ligniaria NRRL 30616 TaxID=1408157 RepID=A0A1J7IV22_9PEZI|nr:hypothetical protein CONLIGDRAFT_678002 [Coniochaeta ligniaria NRRL 30616]